ncbi:MAG: PEGA domain-containing protein [Myxococcota bacterium]
MSIAKLRFKTVSLLFVFSLPLVSASVAHAADKALAESLFDAGRQLMQAGKYEEACPKFAESQRQDPSPGTLINLAKCYEGLGRTASAWAEYKEAATLARTMGRDNQATYADEGAKRLEASVSKLRIDAPKTLVPGMSVMRDGVELGLGSLGIALAVDPGEHVIEVRAPGYKPYSTRVAVKGQADQQVMQIPELERDAAPATPAVTPLPSSATEPTASTPASTAPEPTVSRAPDRTLAYVSGGIGVAGIVVGSLFALSAKGQANAASEDPNLCPQKICTKAGREEINAAERKAMVANVGFGIGILGIGAGLYFLLTEKKESAPATARVTPWLGPNGTGVSYSGAF